MMGDSDLEPHRSAKTVPDLFSIFKRLGSNLCRFLPAIVSPAHEIMRRTCHKVYLPGVLEVQCADGETVTTLDFQR